VSQTRFYSLLLYPYLIITETRTAAASTVASITRGLSDIINCDN